jgi:hypothetical protein
MQFLASLMQSLNCKIEKTAHSAELSTPKDHTTDNKTATNLQLLYPFYLQGFASLNHA